MIEVEFFTRLITNSWFKRVDFPQPEGPTTDTNSLGPTERETSSKASVPSGNVMVTLSNDRLKEEMSGIVKCLLGNYGL